MANGIRIVALGDSVTVGEGFSGVTRETAYTGLLHKRLQGEGVVAEVVPSALDGVDSRYAIRRFERMAARLQPDYLAILLGLNDAKPAGTRSALTPSEYAQNLAELVELSVAINAHPVLATPNPRLDIPGHNGGISDIIERYAEAALELATHLGVDYANVYDAFLYDGRFELLLPDGLHPSPLGHQLIASTVGDTFVRLLGGNRAANNAANAL